jgi:predicted HTH transcriptional regulator
MLVCLQKIRGIWVLKGNFRQDDTPLHRALREALVNALVHADYSGRASILVIKDPAGFVFRNPGMMRVPPEQALRGGESDCRNRTLHQMFLMINLGERAGSGLPKIRQGWEIEGGTIRLFDSFEPYDQTRLEMTWGRMADETGKMTGKMTGKVFDLLVSNNALTVSELAAKLEKSESTIERAIRELCKLERLRRVGSRKSGHWEILDD